MLSRYAWVVPLKDKTGKTLKEAFQVIFKTGRQPIRLQTDRGTDFTNGVFQKVLKENDVHFFTTYNDETKASIVERFNRTLKTTMWKYFAHRETLTYVDVLPDMVALYNRTTSQNYKSIWSCYRMGAIIRPKGSLNPSRGKGTGRNSRINSTCFSTKSIIKSI